MPGTNTEAQLPIFAGQTTSDKSAVACVTSGNWYLVGLADAAYGSSDTTLSGATTVGATSIKVASASSHVQGELVVIGGGTTAAELAYVTAISGTTFTVQGIDGGALKNAHASGVNVRAGVCMIQPQFSGRFIIEANGYLQGSNAGDTIQAQLIYGSLASANAQTGGQNQSTGSYGTLIGNIGVVNTYATNPGGSPAVYVKTGGFSCQAAIGTPGGTGTLPINAAALTVGTPYWVDLAVEDATASSNTVQARSVGLVAYEI